MNILEQTETQLRDEIKATIVMAQIATEEELPDINLEKPKDKQHGDFATNIAMQLARVAKKAPRQIAEDIVQHIDQSKAAIEKVEIAGPGFINFFMKKDYLSNLIPTILEAEETYGQTDTGQGEKIQIEFVSVNPTGRLHLGHARNAAYGDVLANVLTASGYEVEREYYINDAGSQIDNLGLSVEARYLQALGHEADLPEDGYYGKDVTEVAEALVSEAGDKWVHTDKDESFAYFKAYGLKAMLGLIKEDLAHFQPICFEVSKAYGLKAMLGLIKEDLAHFRVYFDHWFSEKTIYEDNQINDALDVLKQGGYVFEKEGATWFRSTDFGDDKDRVLIKKDGNYTYLTPDIAYHKNKFDRGFDKLINVWGGDHHGYIARMEAAIQALGYSKDKFAVKVIQMVSILEQGETLRMSKRSGNAVPLRELMDEVGVDAVRYYFVTRLNDSHLDFDVELARSQSNDNPVFYVQYAHARICTMLEQADKQ